MSQSCSNCGQPTKAKHGTCSRSSCWAVYIRLHRVTNPELREYERAKNRRRRAERVAWLRLLKVGKSCTDCGMLCTGRNYPAFDWDHRPGEVKKFGLAHAQRKRRDEVLAEIAKCDLRCKNCHAVITHQRRRAA